MCSRAVWTVFPCGSSTAFFGVMIIFAFITRGRIAPTGCAPMLGKARADARNFFAEQNHPLSRGTPRHFDALCAPEPERGIYAASTLLILRALKRHKCRAPRITF